MSPALKTNNPLRDKLDDDNLDLSLSQMSEVTEDVVTNIVRPRICDQWFTGSQLTSSYFSRCCPRGPTWTCPTICSSVCR